MLSNLKYFTFFHIYSVHALCPDILLLFITSLQYLQASITNHRLMFMDPCIVI